MALRQQAAGAGTLGSASADPPGSRQPPQAWIKEPLDRRHRRRVVGCCAYCRRLDCYWSQIDDEAAGARVALATAYEANLPEVEVSAAFLERVREEVTTLQQNDAAGLTTLAGDKFVKLKAAIPELAGQLPKTLPKGSAVILRADATGYKILFNWPPCATVQYARPELVVPVRSRNVLGCSHFGVWNQAGAKW